MDKLKLIKSVVFFLTFLLIFGTVILLGSIFRHTRANAEDIPARVTLSEPVGTTIESVQARDGNLYLLLKNGGLSDRVVVIDAVSARYRTTISIN